MLLVFGDSLAWLRARPADSVGAVVCDPPYGLGYMGRSWDQIGSWADGDPMQSWAVDWLAEVHRVLVPGGVVKAFSAPRTAHRVCAAMEVVGFEGLAVEAWVFASGMPKSIGVSKIIDRQAGAVREVVGMYSVPGYARQNVVQGTQKRNKTEFVKYSDTPVTPEAVQWDGWGTALKPAWEPVVVGRKPSR